MATKNVPGMLGTRPATVVGNEFPSRHYIAIAQSGKAAKEFSLLLLEYIFAMPSESIRRKIQNRWR